jgi:hypothetical protein
MGELVLETFNDRGSGAASQFGGYQQHDKSAHQWSAGAKDELRVRVLAAHTGSFKTNIHLCTNAMVELVTV